MFFLASRLFRGLQREEEEEEGSLNGTASAQWRPDTKQSVVLGISFCMVIDFTMSLMSIQTLWYILDGHADNLGLYGFAFGCYDLTQLVFAPVIGWLADRFPLKWVFIGTVLVNITGNLVYALAFWGNDIAYIIAGRLIAGVGSGNLGLCMHYITQTTTIDERTAAVGLLRAFQTTARFVGPNIGYLFLYLPEPDLHGPTAERLLNFYSAPGWVAAVISSIVLVGILVGLDSTDVLSLRRGDAGGQGLAAPGYKVEEEGVSAVQPEQELPKDLHSGDGGANPSGNLDQSLLPSHHQSSSNGLYDFLSLTWEFYALNFFPSALMWGVISQLTAVAMGEYHLIHQQHQLWQVFIAMGVGSFVGFKLWKQVAVTMQVPEKTYILLGLFLMATGMGIVTNFSGERETPPAWRFYAGTGIICAGMQTFYPGVSTSVSKAITNLQHIVTGYEATANGLYIMCGSAARFAGPWLGASLLKLRPLHGKYCEEAEDGDFNSSSCCITTTEFFVNGCFLKHSKDFILCTAVAVLVVACVAKARWVLSSGRKLSS